eukprot:285939_1
MALRRLARELREFENNPLPNVSIGPVDDDMFHWQATLLGPDDTPYKDGVFFLDIHIPQDYPFKSPRIKFVTPIYHCDINARGMISLDIINDSWNPAVTMRKAINSVLSLLSDQNPHDPEMPNIAKLYKTNRQLFNKHANDMAVKYANAPKQKYNVVDLPHIIDANFIYNKNKQQIECFLQLEHAIDYEKYNKHTKNMNIVCMKHKQQIFVNQSKYNFILDSELEYGSMLSIETWIEYNGEKYIKSYSKWYSLFVDILSINQYYLLIEAFLKNNINDMVPSDISNLCFRYYWKYVVCLKSYDGVFERKYVLKKSAEIEENTDEIHGGSRHIKALPKIMKHDIWKYFSDKSEKKEIMDRRSYDFPKSIIFKLVKDRWEKWDL